ncbi:MAG: agmatine deiminase family protein [Planctomycetota bacterium]
MRRRLPAEWEEHRAIWLAWPHNETTWPGLHPKAIAAFEEFVRSVRRFEPVELLVPTHDLAAQISARTDLGGPHDLWVHVVPTDDSWLRDTGPIFCVEGDELVATDWIFNAWGEKYPPWDRDAAVGKEIASRTSCRYDAVDLVLEGGSIETDGRGTVLTTESCLLHPKRNPELDRGALEKALCDRLGVERVLWLASGIDGDDTDGHVDDITRFVDEGRMVSVVESNERDENFAPLRENMERLRSFRDLFGKPYEAVELPSPAPVVWQGDRLPASYANFLFVKGGLLVPVFDDPADDRALGILRELLPDREIVGVPCRELVVGLGAVHCLSKDEPRIH